MGIKTRYTYEKSFLTSANAGSGHAEEKERHASTGSTAEPLGMASLGAGV